MIEWEPPARLEAEKVATPLTLRPDEPRVVLPSLNVTLPVGVPGPDAGATVAVKVTDCPYVEGSGDEPSVVVVAASATPQEENLNEPTRVYQLADCVVAWYCCVYQKVQSSLGSICIAE